MTEYKSCRSCVYWDKPSDKRALADSVYPCVAPTPALLSALLLPESIISHPLFKLHRKYMTRDEGKQCMCWTDRNSISNEHPQIARAHVTCQHNVCRWPECHCPKKTAGL